MIKTLITIVCVALALSAPPPSQSPPSMPLRFAGFSAHFAADGTFTLEGAGWPTFRGTWRAVGGEIEIATTGGPPPCVTPARYRVRTENARTTLDLVSDECQPRRMILDRSTWRPAAEKDPIPERKIVRTAAPKPVRLPAAGPAAGSWPSFRGPLARGVADGMRLPDTWDGASGTNLRWRTPIPGLAHSSPIVWGNRIFVTSAVSGKADATFKPGLYGDGDASDDRTPQRWTIFALDKKTGKQLWQRVAHEGPPRE